MTENLDCINIYEDYQDYFPSLEPYFACINSLQDNNGNYVAATVWLQKSEKLGEVVVQKHRDRKSHQEALKERTYGQDLIRYCIVVHLTPSNGPHRNRQKKTRFGVATGGGVGKVVPIFDVNTISHGFLMMYYVVNGKDPIINMVVKTILISNNICIREVKILSNSKRLVCDTGEMRQKCQTLYSNYEKVRIVKQNGQK